MQRRDAIKLMSALGTAALCGGCASQQPTSGGAPVAGSGAASGAGTAPSPKPGQPAAQSGIMPTIFLAHGSPALLDDTKWVGELKAWADSMPRPKAVLMLSAHWEEAPIAFGATTTVPLYYDFYNFEQRHYEVQYPAPGAPKLASRVVDLLDRTFPVAEDSQRGLDHGAYVPMKAMYPDADVPVLQLSLPTMDAAPLIELGRKLAPLRREGVLIVGSGFLTHNLRIRNLRYPPTFAEDFDKWCEETFRARDVDKLVQYRDIAPGVRLSLPTHEHFVPALISLGAALDGRNDVTYPITGMRGAMTRRSIQFG